MADISQRRPPSRAIGEGPAAETITLQVETVPVGGQHLRTTDHALHLLATWAVRAARAQAEEQVLLDCIAPQSHECTPNPSPGEEMT